MDKMKKRRFAAFLVAAALLLMVGMTGCTGGCSASNNGMSASIGPGSSGSGSSSSYSSSNGSGITGDPDPDHSSSYASSDYPSSSGSSDLSGSSDTMDGSSGTGSSDMMDDILDDITDGDRLPEGSSSSSPLPGSGSGSSSSATAAMGTDFGEIGALSAKGLDWGPGGPRDEKNRSQGAILYNQKYGKYDALFLAADEPVVYMTFDEGYENGLTPDFLRVLKEKNVKGLFFVTYDFARDQPELIRQMVAEGHVIGNHSWSHKNYSTLTPKEAAEDLMKLHDYMKETFGYEMKYFRFPSGNFNEQTLAVVQSMGYKSIFWSFAYEDWLTDRQPEPAKSEERLVNAACPGNIYLLHAVSKTNAAILGSMIDRVRAAGYQWGDPAAL